MVLAADGSELSRYVSQLSGDVLGGVGVVAGVVGHVTYTSAPTRTSTMPLVMRFQAASPTVSMGVGAPHDTVRPYGNGHGD
jgi:hypothetical protein